mgnify:CR=1 FL=1
MKKIFLFILTFLIFCTAGQAKIIDLHNCYIKHYESWKNYSKKTNLEREKYLRRPRSVRIDSEFRLWIPDYESYRIQVYKKDFVELDKTQFSAPMRNPTLEVT